MDLKKYDWSAVIDGVGKVASVFNPAIGGGLMVAGKVLDTLNDDKVLRDDKILENDVIGLTRCSEILELQISNFELSNSSLDIEQLKLVAFNLRSLLAINRKVYKIMK